MLATVLFFVLEKKRIRVGVGSVNLAASETSYPENVSRLLIVVFISLHQPPILPHRVVGLPWLLKTLSNRFYWLRLWYSERLMARDTLTYFSSAFMASYSVYNP